MKFLFFNCTNCAFMNDCPLGLFGKSQTTCCKVYRVHERMKNIIKKKEKSNAPTNDATTN